MTSKPQILAVDDSADSCFLIKVLLERSGHQVTTACSVAEALDVAQQAPFDLFMLDARLPDGDGNKLRQKLRELCPNTPALYFTGVAYPQEKVAALALDGDAYLLKPADPLQIRGAVQQVLQQAGPANAQE